jgi:hypothetical protein
MHRAGTTYRARLARVGSPDLSSGMVARLKSAPRLGIHDVRRHPRQTAPTSPPVRLKCHTSPRGSRTIARTPKEQLREALSLRWRHMDRGFSIVRISIKHLASVSVSECHASPSDSGEQLLLAERLPSRLQSRDRSVAKCAVLPNGLANSPKPRERAAADIHIPLPFIPKPGVPGGELQSNDALPVT